MSGTTQETMRPGLCASGATAGRDLPPVVHLEARRFLVASRQPGVDHYLVDLDEYQGNGWCGCQDFEFRRQPLMERHCEPGIDTTCYHIRMARRVEKVLSKAAADKKNLCETNLKGA